MASIFSFESELPRVSSPWLPPSGSGSPSTSASNGPSISQVGTPVPAFKGLFMQAHPGTPPPGLLSDYNITKLEPEPQTGPAEYKLHLLLRPRRTYSSSSTGIHIAGSQQFKHQPKAPPTSRGATIAPSNQSRQHRLQQLTTQLLWRLQQSSPYHASSGNDLVLPRLPEALPAAGASVRPGKLLAGLEDSRGALYEIGVSDDGTFVGITEDEMEESLTNLRAMAASLGCNVEVTRIVAVGHCEWLETDTTSESYSVHRSHDEQISNKSDKVPNVSRHQAQLWVAEALVTPDLSSGRGGATTISSKEEIAIDSSAVASLSLDSLRDLEHLSMSKSVTQQLRVTLTGPTTSGKSSLLGTLSTATLDNGRGKSRLSLLKHRHEMASGVTSSVAQELLGYKFSNPADESIGVVNFATPGVTTWNDIHATAEGSRIIFVSDSAGHPRYRRTVVRGLVGWAPHWTLLCVAADDAQNASNGAGATSSAHEILGAAGVGVDLAKAHLDLCLKLEKPLAIVITKLDLASKASLRQTLKKVLSAVKATGRVPAMLPADQTRSISEADLATISQAQMKAAIQVVDTMNGDDLKSIVPIILTSSAKGMGIRMLHALLCALPIPPTPTARDYVGAVLNPEQPASLFHIEDTFALPASYSVRTSGAETQDDVGTVVAGYLRFGNLCVGDTIVAGPFPADVEPSSMTQPFEIGSDRYQTAAVDSSRSPESKYSSRSPESGSFSRSFSHPSTTELATMAARDSVPLSASTGEWYNAHIVSIRNLRLPVHRLEAGQAGTIGMVFDLPEQEVSNGPFERPPPTTPRIRKGMVLAIPSHHMIQTGHSLQAASGFTASFEDGDINSVTVGSLVVTYIASIRASARVVRLVPHIDDEVRTETHNVFGIGESFDGGEGFDFGESNAQVEDEPPVFGSDGVTDVTLELMTNREWIELGSQVLIMPGGGQGLYFGSERGEKGVAGLEGFVGKVIEVVD